MRIVEKKDIVIRIREAILQHKACSRDKIDYIELTPSEFKELEDSIDFLLGDSIDFLADETCYIFGIEIRKGQ